MAQLSQLLLQLEAGGITYDPTVDCGDRIRPVVLIALQVSPQICVSLASYRDMPVSGELAVA